MPTNVRWSTRATVLRTFLGDAATPPQHSRRPNTTVQEIEVTAVAAPTASTGSSISSTSSSDDDSAVSTKKHPSRNYTPIQLYDKWVSSKELCSQLRAEKQFLTNENKQLLRDNKTLTKKVEHFITLESKVSVLQDKLATLKSKYETEKDKLARSVREEKDRLLNQKMGYENQLSAKNNEISKCKYKGKSLLTEEKFKVNKLTLEKSNLVERNKDLKCEVLKLKGISKQLDDIKIQQLKAGLQIKTQIDKSDIR